MPRIAVFDAQVMAGYPEWGGVHHAIGKFDGTDIRSSLTDSKLPGDSVGMPNADLQFGGDHSLGGAVEGSENQVQQQLELLCNLRGPSLDCLVNQLWEHAMAPVSEFFQQEITERLEQLHQDHLQLLEAR